MVDVGYRQGNRAAIVRLLSALLMEQNDEWPIMRRYLTSGSLEDLVQKPKEETEEEPLAMTA